jgi:hypothetical protein
VIDDPIQRERRAFQQALTSLDIAATPFYRKYEPRWLMFKSKRCCGADEVKKSFLRSQTQIRIGSPNVATPNDKRHDPI